MTNNKKLLILFVLLFFSNITFAENFKQTLSDLNWYNYWALPAVTFKNISQEISPLTLGAVGVGILVLYPNRKNINDYLQNNLNNTTLNSASSYLTNLGLGYVNIGVAGTLYLFGKEREKEVARMCIESFLLSGIQVQILKHTIGEERPGTTETHLGPSLGYDSFPSGHTSNIFSLATVLTGVYGKPWLFYSIATVIGLTRIYTNSHWLHDVMGGAVIGYTASKYVLRCHRYNKREKVNYEFYFQNNQIKLVFKY